MGLEDKAIESNSTRVQNSIDRFIDLIFGSPYITPSFGEYAMHLAFNSSLRSADLSRQVGAVITKNEEILSTGANDCPKAGGGLYWPRYDTRTAKLQDYTDGRDHTRGEDSNRIEQIALIDSIVKTCEDANIFSKAIKEVIKIVKNNKQFSNITDKDNFFDSLFKELDSSSIAQETIDEIKKVLKESQIRNITEYGRVVHAEMETILSCTRNGRSTLNATLYCTTFPCHNCAKHIIASGISHVVFIEPYLKSKAFQFHKEAITISYPQDNKKPSEDTSNKVKFEPFFGIGPRRFLDLFSLNLGSGRIVVRKNPETGEVVNWSPQTADLRLRIQGQSYLEIESKVTKEFNNTVNK